MGGPLSKTLADIGGGPGQGAPPLPLKKFEKFNIFSFYRCCTVELMSWGPSPCVSLAGSATEVDIYIEQCVNTCVPKPESEGPKRKKI